MIRGESKNASCLCPLNSLQDNLIVQRATSTDELTQKIARTLRIISGSETLSGGGSSNRNKLAYPALDNVNRSDAHRPLHVSRNRLRILTASSLESNIEASVRQACWEAKRKKKLWFSLPWRFDAYGGRMHFINSQYPKWPKERDKIAIWDQTGLLLQRHSQGNLQTYDSFMPSF